MGDSGRQRSTGAPAAAAEVPRAPAEADVSASAVIDVEIDVLVEDDGWESFPDAVAVCQRAARAALASISDEVPPEAEMSITLTSDAAIRLLNRDWRDKDKATNVLSFPAPELPPGVAPQPLGDVIVARETVLAEAEAEEKDPAHHLAHLVVHGTLHLMGFDHEDDEEAEEMEAAERAILAGLGIDDPYQLPLEG
ncbi:endoribonuclease YbeY [Azorhizobium oxalatiphilum]|uniref:Endoribonuclease YbeY n=1 Tax=Azorhizobium oxalatiphilum TaxID=980631 RepID=A0A917FH65_9HYPH|nr:rRNA maturation RNase YbeY [Azorhizobium oxalatiphilum]GGF79978.1 endoribonuclease YbeY [Azorhizobium oxalatiphilum]